tara:strand:- start:3064 stop:3177 length:114 start_codon:yes stop_codon:yes gene_type:complete
MKNLKTIGRNTENLKNNMPKEERKLAALGTSIVIGVY